MGYDPPSVGMNRLAGYGYFCTTPNITPILDREHLGFHRVCENRVRVLDVIDGTPVVDLNPFVPDFVQVEDAHIPEWLGRLIKSIFIRNINKREG